MFVVGCGWGRGGLVGWRVWGVRVVGGAGVGGEGVWLVTVVVMAVVVGDGGCDDDCKRQNCSGGVHGLSYAFICPQK